MGHKHTFGSQVRGQSRIRDTREADNLASENAKSIFFAASLDATVIITIVYKKQDIKQKGTYANTNLRAY